MATSDEKGVLRTELLACDGWKGHDWLVYGFTTRRGGTSFAYAADNSGGELNLGFTAEDERDRVEENRRRLVSTLDDRTLDARKLDAMTGSDLRTSVLCTLTQVHSNRVLKAEGAGLAAGERGDGMTTNQPGLLLAIQTADCVPILLVDLKLRAVAALHAGWRGTLGRIVEAGVNQMRSEYGSRPEDMSAAIGPCIGGCCYQVGQDVRDEFAARFTDLNAYFTGFETDGYGETRMYLDLVEANRNQLVAAGIERNAIYALGECTACNPHRYFSYRRSGGRTGRMMSVIGLS